MLLIVLSGAIALALHLCGVPLLSAEGRNVSSSPTSIALSGQVTFHWPIILLLLLALTGLVLALSSNRGGSHP